MQNLITTKITGFAVLVTNYFLSEIIYYLYYLCTYSIYTSIYNIKFIITYQSTLYSLCSISAKLNCTGKMCRHNIYMTEHVKTNLIVREGTNSISYLIKILPPI